MDVLTARFFPGLESDLDQPSYARQETVTGSLLNVVLPLFSIMVLVALWTAFLSSDRSLKVASVHLMTNYHNGEIRFSDPRRFDQRRVDSRRFDPRRVDYRRVDTRRIDPRRSSHQSVLQSWTFAENISDKTVRHNLVKLDVLGKAKFSFSDDVGELTLTRRCEQNYAIDDQIYLVGVSDVNRLALNMHRS
ncbi:MAG: hypothetical protein Q9N68_13080 [Gammaproteobacteria bacterium]|nr:hypothetical protein [Gammaproteobacteria bacterium]